jgi:hypothetical protein
MMIGHVLWSIHLPFEKDTTNVDREGGGVRKQTPVTGEQ